MKVVSGRGSACEVERLNNSGFHGDNAILILQNAFNHEK
jgi:RNA binding exosome subunit